MEMGLCLGQRSRSSYPNSIYRTVPYYYKPAVNFPEFYLPLVFFCVGQQVKDFLARFETIPDLLELDHLTVSGDVTFGKGVSLKVSSFLVLVGHNGRRRGVRSSLFQALRLWWLRKEM